MRRALARFSGAVSSIRAPSLADSITTTPRVLGFRYTQGTSYLNLIAQPAGRRWSWWGRVILYVADVDALYDRALAAGYQPATAPRDAEWGERFFHLTDPDGHELSFARPLLPVSVQ